MEIVLGTIAILFFLVITVTPILMLNGWFVETVWNWIAVPLFHAPQLTFVGALGLAILSSTVVPNSSAAYEGKKGKDLALAFAGHMLGRYGIGLLVAYIVKGML
jgi:hypothetical protein